MSAPEDPVPAVVRLLAGPLRWRLVRELTAAGQPQNLVPYHLRQLRAASPR